MSLSSLSGSQAASVCAALQQPAENYGNDMSVELHWAIKAYEHAETFFNLVRAVDPVQLRLTRVDEEIYQNFRHEFPNLDIKTVNVDEMKSAAGKEKWREFCSRFEGQVEDWNMGTLLRINSEEDISDDNTTLVPRIQFLAIEVARNREGYNSGLREKYRPTKSDAPSQA